MRRLFLLLLVSLAMQCAWAQQSEFTPELEFVMKLRVSISNATPVGNTPRGYRQFIPITGGTFEGPRLRGKVLSGGADYQLGTQGRNELEAIYNIETEDGFTIHVRNTGMISQHLGRFYFYTTPRFEAPVESPYAWLNTAIFVCRVADEQMDNGVVLNVWKVQDPYNFDQTIIPVLPVPRALFTPAAQQGRLQEFSYKVMRDGKKLTKHAQVYTPYGYNRKDKKRYNVVYLMHGGGDNSTSFFMDSRSPLPLANVLDHLIAEGKMDPVIVVTPTFYPDDRNIGENRMQDAITLCRDFHLELQNELIPAVESAFSTYLTGRDSMAVTASREHRAYGGFSMGALSTWYQLAYGVNAVKHFIPLSGDLWTYDSKGQKQSSDLSAAWINKKLQESGFGNDFEVYGYTGTDDIAGNPQKNLVRSLSEVAPLFRYNRPDANLRFAMKQGGKHYYGDINEYLYYALPLIWKKK